MISGFTAEATCGCLCSDIRAGRKPFQVVRCAKSQLNRTRDMNQILAVFGSMNIENKTVLVTGSTDGVGRLGARRLADRGARVPIRGRDRTRGEPVANGIRAPHRRAATFLPSDFFFLSKRALRAG